MMLIDALFVLALTAVWIASLVFLTIFSRELDRTRVRGGNRS